MTIILDGTNGATIPTATAAAHAVQLQQVSLYPTVASSATIDIFGAAGATINVSGTVTVTGITACTAAQIGSVKTIIPSNAAGFSITATANIVVDGATSGTYLMPQNANVQIIATSTTTFKITTIFSTGVFTPVITGTTIAGTGTYTTQIGNWTKIGNTISYFIDLAWTAHTGTGNMNITGMPFTAANRGNNPAGSIATYNLALTAGYFPLALIGASSTQLNLNQSPTGGGAYVAIPIDTSVNSLSISGQYQV